MGLYTEKTVAARKAHRCYGCCRRVEVGATYLRITTQYDDGTPCHLAYHPDCRTVEVYLYRINELDRDPDDWMSLHEHVSESGRGVLQDAPESVQARFPEAKH